MEKKVQSWFHEVGIAVIAVLWMNFPFGNVARAEDAAQPLTLTVSQLLASTQPGTYVAEQKGFVKDEGFVLKLDTTRTPADGLANLVAGRSDVAVLNVGSIAQAISQNIPIRIIMPVAYATSDIGLYVKADSSIKSVADLKGKTISLAQLQNSVHAFVLKQLDDAGVDLGSVKFTVVPIANALSVLRAGTIDAAQINEPFITDAGATIRPVMRNLSGDKWLLAYYITTEQFAKNSAKLLDHFASAMNKTYAYARANPVEFRKLVGDLTGITGSNLTNMTLAYFDGDQKAALADAKQQLKLLEKFKIIPSAPDLARYMK